MNCPKYGSENVLIQREQTASIGAATNKVVIQEPKKSKGCLYWCLTGWYWAPVKFICFGWLKPLFGGKKRGGLNIKAEKTFNKTVAACQDCGHSWKL